MGPIFSPNGAGAYKGKAIFISGGSGSVGQTGETLSAKSILEVVR
jgi:hypothetical protein